MSDTPDKVIDLAAQVEARLRQEAAELAAAEAEQVDQDSTAGGPDDPRFVMQCLANNERGDGILFTALQRGQFVYNKTNALWYSWAGHHWEVDKLNLATTGVESVALKYLDQAAMVRAELDELRNELGALETQAETCRAAKDQAGADAATGKAKRLANQVDAADRKLKGLNKRVERLRTVRGASNCLTWAHCVERPLAIVGDEIDKKPMLLACKNGVIDLETGRLHPGNPSDYLVRAIPVEYYGIEHVNEDWERFQRDIHQDDEDFIGFVRRYFGYSITGLTKEQHLACFIGEGANGKGTMFETLHEVLGELAWSIDPEMILEQKNAKSSAGPSPDIVSLYGRRLVIASETDPNRRISGAKVKRLTGSDTLTGRAPHDKYEINFIPTHTLAAITNHAPRGLAADFALFRRLLYLNYPLRYVADPELEARSDPQNAGIYRQRDPDLPAKLLANKPGILAWLVRGCLEWQRDGLKPPEQLRAAAEEIRRNEDHLARFIDDNCERVDADRRIMFKALYANFDQWFADNVDEDKRYRPGKKAIGDQLRRKGYRVENSGGQVYVYGLTIEGCYA
ncbi:MAG: phage/plasmid primase, P4 family [Pedobacter sp.]